MSDTSDIAGTEHTKIRLQPPY